MNAQKAGELFAKSHKEHCERMERWAQGKITITEVVEQMTCLVCDKGVNYDGKTCEFCTNGFTVFPAAADALRFLAKQERDNMQRLAEELLKIQERRERRKQKKAAQQGG